MSKRQYRSKRAPVYKRDDEEESTNSGIFKRFFKRDASDYEDETPEEEFARYDLNNDGKVTAAELDTFRSPGDGISAYQIRQLVRKFDKDKSGALSLDEFLRMND